MSAVFAIVSGLALMTSASSGASDAGWYRVDSLDSDLSFEVPCSPDNVEFREEGVPEVGGSRVVLCKRGGATLMVSVTQFPEGETPPVLDELFSPVPSSERDHVKPVKLAIEGRRYAADRSEDGVMLGQRAAIQINPRKVALIMAGGASEDPASKSDLIAMIDRFFASFKVES